MKKVLLLVKKDLFLDKTYLLVTILLSFGIPMFIAKSLKDVMDINGIDVIALMLSSFYCYFMMFSKIGLIEDKYKSVEYLLLTPISRKMIVMAKYFLFVIIFIFSIVGYIIDSFIFIDIKTTDLATISIVFLIGCIFMGIYIPLELKVGYEKVKFYLMIIVIATPLCVGGIGKSVTEDMVKRVNEIIGTLIPYFSIISILMLFASYYVANRIYEKKDI